MARRALAAVIVAVLAGAPSIAAACPSCAIRDNTPGRYLVLAGMVLLPFAVGGASIAIIRRMMRAEAAAENEA